MNHAPSPDRITVGMLWHSVNSANYGVGALTAAHMRILDEIGAELNAEISFEIVGWSNPMPQYINHPRATFHPFSPRFMLAPRGGLRSLARRCTLVFDISGGDSFTDLYGMKRFWYQALSKAIVIAAGTPLVLAPQTIGPFSRHITRQIARMIMRRCKLVVVRDELSGTFVRSLDRSIPLAETTDVAFSLPYQKAPIAPDDKVRVGINVSGLLYSGGYRKKNDFGLGVDYPALMREIVRRFTGRADCEVHLVAHVIVPRKFDATEDDIRAAERLSEEFPDVRVAVPPASPSEFKSQIATMDFFCGSRMHACIAAFSAGVPTVPLAYSRKFIGLFQSIGFPLVADCVEETSESILAKVEDAFARRDELRTAVAQANAEAARRITIYKSEIVRCLRESRSFRSAQSRHASGPAATAAH